jgi:hypothetical protein
MFDASGAKNSRGSTTRRSGGDGNDEIRMTNDEWGTHAFFIRHSDFVIRHFVGRSGGSLTRG